jgi:thiol-disulfide isomerase/thioredoxin
MKNLLLPFLFLMLLVNSATAQEKETIIKGQVIGETPEKVIYTIPINDTYNYKFKDTITTDVNGNFEIKLKVKQTSLVRFLIYKKAGGALIVEPKGNYEIVFDLKSKDQRFNIDGDNKEGQELYQNNFLDIDGQLIGGVARYRSMDSLSLLEGKINTNKVKSVSKFKRLYDKSLISKAFFNFIKKERETYYTGVVAGVLKDKFIGAFKNNKSEEFTIEMNDLWNKTFVKYPAVNEQLINSPYWYEYAKNYVEFKEYTRKDFSVDKILELFKQGKIHAHFINEAKKHLSGKMLEFYQASYISEAIEGRRYEKELISIFYEFKKDFPNSHYTRFLEPKINTIIKYHDVQNKELNTNIKFMPNYENLNTFNDVLRTLKGKKVYVDVWATWCGPCKDEFKHKKALNKLLKSKDVEILYLSVDKDERDTQWKEMIKFYNLEGQHIRANKKLSQYLYSFFDSTGTITIPWYLLIDVQGNIIKKYAKRPSELEELEKELNEI